MKPFTYFIELIKYTGDYLLMLTFEFSDLSFVFHDFLLKLETHSLQIRICNISHIIEKSLEEISILKFGFF